MFLGLDLGTSGLRAVLANDGGTIIASSEGTYPVAHAHPGWSEQDPADWIAALNGCVAELRSSHPAEFAALKGIGVSGHMHGATCLDDSGDVIRPCILWNDTRSHAEAAALDAAPRVRDLSGNIVFPGFTAPKLVWMQKNEPENFARVAKVLLPAAYLNFYMTGRYFADMSDSAGTSWLDVGARDWSDVLLSASGMRRDQMPELVEGSEAGGTLRPELAADWGVSSDVAVVGGGGDNAVAACGVGTLREGDGFVSLGTSGVLLAAKDSFAPMPSSAVHTFCHAIPGTWYQMGVILAATDSLNWLSRNLGKGAADLSRDLGETISGPGDLRFLPYLSGERTPHNDSAIRGAFIGLDIGAGHAELTQAVMEGVSFALRDNLAALESTGTKLDRVLAIGGGSQSPYWVELLATLLNIQIDLPEAGDFGAALGAARLAICGATGAKPTDIMTAPAVAKTISPRADLVAAYQDAWQKYRASYSAIKAIQ
ncbi:xylulose kinase [Actibacterium mucosum KCTC 23349]|uniref:Xylulose kinase n=1 Tax=Actibacterium mucosum KCTC 23349 TaxID=1454373 RepID=A0A037ZLQ5_9RHOB|nr:xylulose kinase [Actibacterium mucosum KCTC 23349]